MYELKDKEGLNPKDFVESRTEVVKRFDWADIVPIESDKQAVQDVSVGYQDIFARHRMVIGMNTEFKVKIASKGDKAAFSQNLPKQSQLK